MTARLTATIALLTLICFTHEQTRAAEGLAPKRLTRADSFLGIHFDFHAGPDCTNVGAFTTPQMVEGIIRKVHPDYLQIDCKGHPGLSSYPTKVGHQAPRIIGDPLRIWRDTTARLGVGLFMHYSGVYDAAACQSEPGWAVVNSSGKPSKEITSVFGPYADKLLIPQLRELASDYGIDGAWVDGECWSTLPDYGPEAIRAFLKQTGLKMQDIPKKTGEPHWYEFQQFHREAFRKYLRHYIAEVKKTNPRFQLCSNWAFTDHMAEPVSALLDFLSGDYSPQDSVNSARLSARYLSHQGKPWDLMAWSFTTQPDRQQKTAVQLKREAAIVLAQGGGFQAYFQQKRDGSIWEEQMEVMAEVAQFCRERQAFCHHSTPVPQIGLLLSTYDQYHRIRGLYSRELDRISGTLQALVESQHPVEVVGEHHLGTNPENYPVLVVPECESLAPEFQKLLISYVKHGGNLLLVGPSSGKLFVEQLRVDLGEPVSPAELPIQLSYAGATVEVKSRVQPVFSSSPGTSTLGEILVKSATGTQVVPAATILSLGRGRIALCHLDLGRAYLKGRPDVIREYLSSIIAKLQPHPIATVEGSRKVEIAVTRNHGKLMVNLINVSGPHATESIIQKIDPLGPLTVTVHVERKPQEIVLEPGHRKVTSAFSNGILKVEVPQVQIHDIVTITPSR